MNASNNGQFWARDFETLTRAEQQKLEAPLLAQQIEYVFANSTYYRRKFDEAGVRPETVTTEQALDQGPFTEKPDITESQTKGSMLGLHQCASFDDVVRIVATGGSSAPPTRLGWTRSDIDLYNEMGARALWTMGCRPSDLVIIVSTTACTRAAS
jgi:phenylacetate-CoA ligase